MLRIQLLGDFKISDSGEPLTGLTKPRMQSLLAYLLLHGDAPQARAHVAYTFWPDSTDKQARTNLRRELLQLRRALPRADEFLRIDTQTVQWDPDADFMLDVAEFTAILAAANSSADAQEQADLRQTAVDIYHGDLLPGLYEEWILARREALAQQYVRALEKLVDLHTVLRNFAPAVRAAQRLLRYDPLYEAGTYRLMELYAYQNERARALHTYHTYASLLERELGVDPGSEIQALYDQLRRTERVAKVEIGRKASESMQLVGRTAEWQTLLARWRRAQRGHASFVLIEGEAGIGKTRLGEELLEWVNRQGISTARTRSYAAEGSLAYAPVIEWLRSDALRGRLEDIDTVWQTEIARLLPEMLSANPRIPHPEPLTEQWHRQRLFEALARALTAGARPILLLIDDLQWSDQETLEWLRYLLRYEPMAPLLILGTARPEEVHEQHPLRALLTELGGGEQLTTIPLSPLNSEETRALAEQVCGKVLGDQESARLFAASEGYPLFVVEMVRAGYHEQTTIEEEDVVSMPGARLPPKVVAVIQSRLAQLSPAAHKLADLAATIGRSFEYEVLAAAGDEDEDAVANGLDELWQRRIITEQGINAYDFSHDRIREVVYAAISPARRKLFHQQVAAALLQQHTGDLDSVSARLAVHYGHAGLVDEAVQWRQRAAQASLSLHAPIESIHHIRAGLSTLEQKPLTRDRQELELQLLLLLGRAYLVAYGFASPEYEEILMRTQAAAEAVENLTVLTDLIVSLSEMSIARGRIRAARRLVDGALARLGVDTNPLLAISVYRQDARVATHLGDFVRARRSMERTLSAQMPFPDDNEREGYWKMYGFANLCCLLWLTGDSDQAAEAAARALDEGLQYNSPFDFTNILFLTAITYRNAGDLALVEANAQQMLAIGDRHDLPLSQQSGNIFSGWVLAQQGDVLGGIQQTKRGIEGFRQMGHFMYQTHRLAMFAEMHLMAGQIDEAQTLVDEALAISNERDEHFWDVELSRLQGDILLAQGAEIKAEDAFHQAVEIARKQGARSLELRALTALCRLWQGQGKHAQAYQHLAELYGWFSEGFGTNDLQAAKALLDELQ
jgi:DNA-binding SARP family transcriptional activator